MTASAPRVLDVGQCNLDHGNLSRLLTDRFGARVDRAHSLEEAIRSARRERYDLVLVNRLFDADGTEGLEFIRRLLADPTCRETPVMLVSNYVEAQASAVALGAMPGFGKAALDSPQTHALIAEALSRRSS